MINALRAGTLAVLLAACTHRVSPNVAPRPVVAAIDSGPGVAARDFAAHDTTVLAAVARALADSSRIPVRIDPERLPSGLDAAGTVPTKDEFRNGAVVAQVGSIADAALRAVNIHNCSSGLAVDDSVVSHAGCPKTRFKMAVFGSPRPGGPQNPPHGPRFESKPGYWSVRVVVADVGPGGFNVTVFDYVCEKRSTGWEFVGDIALFFID
jgi:hypothetical protein